MASQTLEEQMHHAGIRYEVRGEVARIKLLRPEKRNAIDARVALDLHGAWQRFEAGDERVAVFAGEGDLVSSGAVVTDLPEPPRCIPTIGATVEKPVIAAVSQRLLYRRRDRGGSRVRPLYRERGRDLRLRRSEA